jgi:hypothetical protein
VKIWTVYRLDDERALRGYVVWSPTREAAIRCAHVEWFGLVLLPRMLSARLGLP